LSLLKTANISGYLLNLDTVCTAITTARLCIANCHVDSNPFALESMTAACTKKSLTEAQMVSPCLSQQGDQIIEQCITECGDYDEINDQVHNLTVAFKPAVHHHEGEQVNEVMSHINTACTVLKCSNRCATKMMSEKCKPLGDGRAVGSVVREMIERVLVAQRRDLERMKLVDVMAHTVPLQCNFMYMPEVMFNTTKDNQALAVIEDLKRTDRMKGHVVGENDKRKELNLSLSQIQAHLLRKQIHLLELQEHNLIREGQKLDMELQMLERKRMQSTVEVVEIKK